VTSGEEKIAALLDSITAVLVGWERTKNERSLTPALIAEGMKILEEAKK
jgi:hypothetical protein